nr:viral methyltransferase [Nigrospora aurantiaca tobamo-like virus 1]
MEGNTEDYKAALNRAVTSASADPHSVVSTVALAPLQAQFSSDTQYAGSRRKVTIRVALSADDRSYLQNVVYKHVNLEFSASAASGHGLAYARRAVEQEMAISKAHRGQRVVDVGGNWQDHIVKGRWNIHSCCPILDARDDARRTRRMAAANKWARMAVSAKASAGAKAPADVKVRGETASRFLRDSSEFFCSREAQACGVAAEVALFLDSIYDIDFFDLPLIMDAHSCHVGHGYFIFEPSMLIDQSGTVRGYSCHWERRMITEDVEVAGIAITRRTREVITFTFEGDSNLEYTHDYVNYVRWATQSVVRRGDKAFLIERTFNEGQVSFEILEIGKALAGTVTRLSFSYWQPAVKDKIGVRLYWLDGLAETGVSSRIRWTLAWTDSRLVEKVLAYGFRLSDEKFTPKTMYDYCSSANVRASINGVDVSVKESASTLTAWRLTFTLWFVVFMEKYETGFVHSFFLGTEMKRRDLRKKSLFGLALSFVTQSMSGLLNGEDTLLGTTRQKLLTALDDKLKSNVSVPFPGVEELVPFVRFEEVLQDFSGSYEAKLADPDEVEKWAKDLRNLYEPEVVSEALDNVVAQLRVLAEGEPGRSELQKAAGLLNRRLMTLRPDYAGEPDRPWSDVEQCERALDLREEMPGGKFGSPSAPLPSTTVCETDAKTPPESVNCAKSDSVTPSGSASVGPQGLVKLLTLCGNSDADEFERLFRGTAWLDRGSAAVGLCGVDALVSAAGSTGKGLSRGQALDALIEASAGLRTDWFEWSDMAIAAVSLGFRLGLVLVAGLSGTLTTWEASGVQPGAHLGFVALKGSHYYSLMPGTTPTATEELAYELHIPVAGASDSEDSTAGFSAFSLKLDDVAAASVGGSGDDVTVLRNWSGDSSNTRSQTSGGVSVGSVGSRARSCSAPQPSTVESLSTEDEPKASPGKAADQFATALRAEPRSVVEREVNRASTAVGSTKPRKKPERLSPATKKSSTSTDPQGEVSFNMNWRLVVKAVVGFAAGSSLPLAVKFLGFAAVGKVILWTGSGFLVVLTTVVPPVLAASGIVLPGLACAYFAVKKDKIITQVRNWRTVAGRRDTLWINPPTVPKVKTVRKLISKPKAEVTNRYKNGWLTPQARVKDLRTDPGTAEEVKAVVDAARNARPKGETGLSGKQTSARPEAKPEPTKLPEGSPSEDMDTVKKHRDEALLNYYAYVEASVRSMENFCTDVAKMLNAYGSTPSRLPSHKTSPDGACWLIRRADGFYSPPSGVRSADMTEVTCLFFDGQEDKILGTAEYVPEKDGIRAWFPMKKQPERLLFVKALLKFLDFKTLQVILKAGIKSVDPKRKITLVAGVPGCGKSSEVTATYREGDIVAVQSTGGAEELQQKFKKNGKDPSAIRTIGSRLLGAPKRGQRLLVDEALKCHYGELLFLSEVVSAREVLLFGDDNQIGFSNRVPDFDVPDLDIHWTEVFRTKSYTAPQDVVVMLGRLSPGQRGGDCDGKGYYPNGFVTANTVVNSMAMTTIAGDAGNVPRHDGAKYLTWTRDSKKLLTQAGFKNVNTVDEFQGGRASHVVLVRLEKNMDIRHRTSTGQMIVAASRHTHRFDYVTIEQTPNTEDLLHESLSRMKAVDDITRAYGEFTIPVDQ